MPGKLTPEEVCGLGQSLFRGQDVMTSRWQTMAENFYPERADFLAGNVTLHELADNLTDSYPVILRRDLGNSFHSMLRDGQWFEITVGEDSRPLGRDGRGWLQWATSRQYRMMHDRASGFVRACKEGDMDFTTFGQAVISVEPNRYRNGLVYRSWHLRDCAWNEDETGQVCAVARRWRPTRFDLIRLFGRDNLPAKLLRNADNKPFETEEYKHVVLPAELYWRDDQGQAEFPYYSLYVDLKEKRIVEERGLRNKHYVVPRFQTIAGSPYAYSPATMAGLADARTLQAMTHTLLEAGERYARPPIVAVANAVTGVVDLSPDGITYVDDKYDERLGQALRTLGQDRGGFPIGASERTRVYEIMNQAFYLDQLNQLLSEKEMTAYEVQERRKMFRRQALPLFAPMEDDYNGQLCEVTFDMMMQMGLLGSPVDIPQELQGQDVRFKYQSPLTQTEQEEKVARFQETSQLLREAADLDAGVADNVDFDTALRETVQNVGAPVDWLRPMDAVQDIRQQRATQQAAQVAMEAAGSGQGVPA